MLDYNKIYLILATIVSANIYLGFLPKTAAFFLGAALLILAALAYSQKRDGNITLGGIALSAVSLLTLLVLLSVPFFYISHLGKFFVILCLLIIFAKTKNADIKFSIINYQFSRINILAVCCLPFFASLLYLLAKSASGNAIASPWLFLPSYFFPLFFSATALLLYITAKKPSLALLAILFFLFFSIAAIIYKFGYGFDQFIHEAAQKYIVSHGSISPKSIQYIGLYGINIFLHYITGANFAALNAFLLPAASMLLPLIAYITLKEKTETRPFSIFAVLLLPFSYFIVTTPQGLANLLLLIFIFRSLSGYKSWGLPLTTFFIHPIAGIIALIYAAFICSKYKKIIAALGIFALPAAFTFLSYKSGGGFHINFNFTDALKQYWSLLAFGGLKQNYNFWLDLVYLIQYLLLPTIIAASIFAAWRYKEKIFRYPLYLFGITTASFFATAIFADFSYLIGYEQKNYPERLFYISFLFLAPYLILAAEKIYERIISPTSPPPLITKREESVSEFSPLGNPRGELEGGFIYKIFFAALFAFAITANFYLTYPRWDNYQNDKGKNVTAAMLRAVELIKNDVAGKNYVVLTDQAVSAAALKLDGFKRYYSTPLGEIFYYPIPTGGPLYNEFLNLVYNNTGAKAASNAKILTGTEAAYIILPSYWENYERIKENLKTEMRVIFEDKNLVILKWM